MGFEPTAFPVTGERSNQLSYTRNKRNLTDFGEKCYNFCMEPTFQNKLEELEKKIDAIYVSVEKTRKYILWTAVVTVAIVVLPLIGLLFAIPSFINTYTTQLETLGL